MHGNVEDRALHEFEAKDARGRVSHHRALEMTAKGVHDIGADDGVERLSQ